MTQILMPKCLHMYKCIMSYKVQDIANQQSIKISMSYHSPLLILDYLHYKIVIFPFLNLFTKILKHIIVSTLMKSNI